MGEYKTLFDRDCSQCDLKCFVCGEPNGNVDSNCYNAADKIVVFWGRIG